MPFRIFYPTLCEFAKKFPRYVASFLQFGDDIIGWRFREDTVTDHMMALLKRMERQYPNMFVDYPSEKDTGADMEWNFVRFGKNNQREIFFRLFIQAKRLDIEGISPKKHYKYIFNKSGKTGKAQVEILTNLTREKKGRYPLYAFYNPEEVCTSDLIAGINLANGYVIRALYENKKERSNNKEFEKISPFFFLLKRIFCSSSSYLPKNNLHPPDPSFVCNRISRQRAKILKHFTCKWIEENLTDFWAENHLSHNWLSKRPLARPIFENISTADRKYILGKLIPVPKVACEIPPKIKTHITRRLTEKKLSRTERQNMMLKFIGSDSERFFDISDRSEEEDEKINRWRITIVAPLKG